MRTVFDLCFNKIIFKIFNASINLFIRATLLLFQGLKALSSKKVIKYLSLRFYWQKSMNGCLLIQLFRGFQRCTVLKIVFFSSQNIDRDWKYIQPTAYISQSDSRKVNCAFRSTSKLSINLRGFFFVDQDPFPLKITL